MGKVYRDFTVPIPAWAVRSKNGHVHDGPSGKPDTVLIGYAVSETEMHPNENYKTFYYREFAKYAPAAAARVRDVVLRAGLTLAVLGTAQKLGVYDALAAVLGPAEANACMDYVLYRIAVEGDYKTPLSNMFRCRLTFTSGPMDETWYEAFFQREETADKINAVLEQWLRGSAQRGASAVYLLLDGTDAEGADSAAPRIWAVSAKGNPVRMPNPGEQSPAALSDPAAMGDVLAKVAGYGLKVKGIVCSSPQCASAFLQLRQSLGIPCFAALSPDTAAFQALHDRYSAVLRGFPLDHFAGHDAFGIAVSDGPELQTIHGAASLCLLRYPEAEGRLVVDFINAVFAERNRIEEALQNGADAAVPRELEAYLQIQGTGKDRKLLVHSEKVDADTRRMGFVALASSEPQTAKELAAIDSLRQFPPLPSDGGRAAGLAQWFLAYLAAAIAAELESASQAAGMDPDCWISELDEVKYQLWGGAYQW